MNGDAARDTRSVKHSKVIPELWEDHSRQDIDQRLFRHICGIARGIGASILELVPHVSQVPALAGWETDP